MRPFWAFTIQRFAAFDFFERNSEEREHVWLQTSLVEKHMERIRSLESALRQRDSSLQKLNMQLHSKDMQYLQLHAGPDTHSE